MSPGAVTEIIHFFIAEYDEFMKVSGGGGLITEHEDIEVLEINFQKALRMIKSGEIIEPEIIEYPCLTQRQHREKYPRIKDEDLVSAMFERCPR